MIQRALDWPTAVAAYYDSKSDPPKKIYDEHGNQVDNGYLWAIGGPGKFLEAGAFKVMTVANMATQVIDAVGSKKSLDQLFLVGHGTEGDISTGAGQSGAAIYNDATINASNRDVWDKQLENLSLRMAKNSTIEVFLVGCSTGAEKTGLDFLADLATFFAERVSGSTVRVWGAEVELYASDVKEIVLDGRRTNMRYAEAAGAKVTMSDDRPTPANYSGLRVKDPTRLGKSIRDLAPQPEDYGAIAFRDHASAADASAPVVFLSPPPVTARELLSLYDLEHAYDPHELGTRIVGSIYLRRGNTHDELTVVMNGRGIIFSAGGEDLLFVLRDPRDNTRVRGLLRRHSA